MLWASEFIDAARDVYNANKTPYTIVDGRDIRDVDPSEVVEKIDMKPGEVDLLDGSPPCSSFSGIGKKYKGWGKSKKYSADARLFVRSRRSEAHKSSRFCGPIDAIAGCAQLNCFATHVCRITEKDTAILGSYNDGPFTLIRHLKILLFRQNCLTP